MPELIPLPAGAFSNEGFIINQDAAEAYPYGAFSSDINGCGWIACFNLLHALGRAELYQDVYQEMNAILTYKGMMGTPMPVMRRYLTAKKLNFQIFSGRTKALKQASRSNFGIIRYFEGKELHFVTYQRQSAQLFRFFNAVYSEAKHDLTMDDFFRHHCRLPFIKVIIIKD